MRDNTPSRLTLRRSARNRSRSPTAYLASMTTTVSGISVVAAQMIGNYLVVGDTMGNDSIVFTPGTTPGSLNVTLNATYLGLFSPANSVVIYGNGGTDNVTVNGTWATCRIHLYPKDVVLTDPDVPGQRHRAVERKWGRGQ